MIIVNLHKTIVCFLDYTTDTLLNVFLAIAVDNLANAQILTEDEENENLERIRNRELNKQKYSQKPSKTGWDKAGAKLPVVLAINHFVRKKNGHASTSAAEPNNIRLVCFLSLLP